MKKLFKINYEFLGLPRTFETEHLSEATTELERLDACHEVPNSTIEIHTVNLHVPMESELKTAENTIKQAAYLSEKQGIKP